MTATASPALPPAVAERLSEVVSRTRRNAADLLAVYPAGPMRKHIKAAVQKVDAAAVRVATAGSQADVCELRAAVDAMVIRTTEMVSLTTPHADPLARMLWVAREVADVVLGEGQGEQAAKWAENLEGGQ